MSFSPTITHDSKTVPGVRFTVRRMGFGRRVDLDFKTLELRQRLRELEIENPPLTDREKELAEQLSIARKKAMAVPPEEFEAVLAGDVRPLVELLAAASDVSTRKRRAALAEEYSVVELKIRAEWIRAGLVSIEHKPDGNEKGEYDGITAEQILADAPPQLALEIYDSLAKDGKIAGDDAKNSFSPTTSGAPVGGKTDVSTAPTAELQPAATS
jgi:hypothetical protein